MNINLKIGSFVEFDGLIAVVVGLEGEPNVPENHVALWFGDSQVLRKSNGGTGGHRPMVITVPIDLCEVAKSPKFAH